MNNVSQITKAKRLTEEEVHVAAEELEESGIKASSIEIYKHLGRGSLTTITNFMKTWNQAETQKSTLPALISLPDTLKKITEELIIKIWAESQKLATAEINNQREALRQAEAMANEKIKEAEAFSEEQTKQIEQLETEIELLENEKIDAQDFSITEEKRLTTMINDLLKNIAILEEKNQESERKLQKIEMQHYEQVDRIMNEHNTLATQRDEALKNTTRLETELKQINKNIEKEIKDVESYREKATKQASKADLLENKLFQEKMRIESVTKENNQLNTENRALIGKAAMLEGELKAYKNMKLDKENIKTTTLSPAKKPLAKN